MNIQINFTSSETRTIVLPDAANRTIISLFVWTKHRNVTDRQMDISVVTDSEFASESANFFPVCPSPNPRIFGGRN